MISRSIFLFVLVMVSAAVSHADDQSLAEQTAFTYTIRYGQGGFNESRSPRGKLGGGEIAFDINSTNHPLSLSISTEFYTNSAEPTHNYEISDIFAISLLYKDEIFESDKMTFFAGGGVGKLKVPVSEITPSKHYKADSFTIGAGLLYRFKGNFGVYGTIKHLFSEKEINNIKVIDFDETIVLVGISYDFAI